MNKILVVDDERAVRYSFERAFGKEYLLLTAENGMDAIEKVKKERPDIVLVDIKMPKMNGIETLKKIKEVSSEVPIIMMTAFGDTETAIEAMKEGAYDYITKPFENTELKAVIEKVLASSKLFVEAKCFSVDEDLESIDRIIGKSSSILNVCKLIGQVAQADVPVLLIGESGVGKELIARAIHYHHNKRKDKLFIAVNCAALPENLIESELFGYEHGAFTGADRKRIGRFEQCNGGTILLDEIGDMSQMTQSKVLRVLQDSKFERLGGNQTIKVDVRVIAATNKDLLGEVKTGRFRPDLYHRLNVVSMNIPPLRERTEDIPILVEYFIKRANRETGRNIRGISPDGFKTLESYSWPGNVRELENTIWRAVIVAKGTILSKEDLMFPKIDASTNIVTLKDAEKFAIKKAMEATKGNKTKAASLLEIDYKTLLSKIRQYDL